MTSGDRPFDAVKARKKEARRAARAARRAIDPAARAAASVAVASRAIHVPEVAGARSVLAYAALPEELDPAPLVEALRQRGARIALPRVCAPGVLALHWVEAKEPLAVGWMGVSEPPEACTWASPAEFDLVLVPGVAFDATCRRLGFGGGYYDEFLAALPQGVPAVGLAFEEQMCDEVPHEEHDAVLDAVVTPTAVHRRER